MPYPYNTPYGGYFPQGYPYSGPFQSAAIPTYQGPQGQQSAQGSSGATGGIAWCTEQQAIDFVPQAGPAVALWLREGPTIYLKSLDNMGKPQTVILDYQERTQKGPTGTAPADTGPAYALKSDLDELRAQVERLLSAPKKPMKNGGPADGE